MEKEYRCVCGKIFSTSNKINGHKSYCKEYMKSIGRDVDKYMKDIHDKISVSSKKLGAARSKCAEEEHSNNMLIWISEKHVCERCGKIMTEYYGSGRFCSRFCANARPQSEQTRRRICQSSKNHILTDVEWSEIQDRISKQGCKRIKYSGPDLPELVFNDGVFGYSSRKRIPYSERFWKQVFDNNNVNYSMDVKIKNPDNNKLFRLDFLIGNVDVEIDGQFHTTEYCVEKDARRTKYLESIGYVVYRIPWVNPISEKNKIIVHQQIVDLFKFLNIEHVY